MAKAGMILWETPSDARQRCNAIGLIEAGKARKGQGKKKEKKKEEKQRKEGKQTTVKKGKGPTQPFWTKPGEASLEKYASKRSITEAAAAMAARTCTRRAGYTTRTTGGGKGGKCRDEGVRRFEVRGRMGGMNPVLRCSRSLFLKWSVPSVQWPSISRYYCSAL